MSVEEKPVPTGFDSDDEILDEEDLTCIDEMHILLGRYAALLEKKGHSCVKVNEAIYPRQVTWCRQDVCRGQ